MKKRILIPLIILQAMLACCAGSKKRSGTGTTGGSLIFKDETISAGNLYELIEKSGQQQILRVEFQHCTFQGSSTSMSNLPDVYHGFAASLLFRDCTFESMLNLQGVSYAGRVDFSKCRFKKDVIIKNSVFLAPFGMRECGIDGEAGFQNCTFLKESTWMGTYFYTLALFQGSTFLKPAQFQNVHFTGNADFSLCRMQEGAIFDFCVAGGKLDFTETRQEGLMTFRKSILKKGTQLVKFRSFAPLKFLETEFEDSLQVRGFRWFAEKPEILNPQGSKKPEKLFD